MCGPQEQKERSNIISQHHQLVDKDQQRIFSSDWVHRTLITDSMLSSRFTSLISRKSSLLLSSSSSASATTATSTTQTTAAIRHNLSKCWSPSRDLAVSSFSTFRPSRRPGKTYQSRHQPKPLKRTKPVKGPKEPNDVSRTISKIDFSKIDITDVDDEPLDDWSDLGPLMTAAIQKARHETAASASASGPLDVETQLKMMDYFISAPGSTEDLVGERRALSLESWDGQDRDAIEREIDRLIHQERIDYMELPELDVPTLAEMEQESGTGSNKVPTNQLAHGDWYVQLLLLNLTITNVGPFYLTRFLLLFHLSSQGRNVDSYRSSLQNVARWTH